MDKLFLKYFTFDKSPPPQPVRLKVPGWSGPAQKMEDGSEPQPWHCMPFTEGATAGLELTYPYETECHVVNDNGNVRFEWDFAREPSAKLTGGEFVTFFPKEASKFYLFNTGLDLLPPPGYVIRTEPHPRFFTDETGTAPIAIVGHVQSEWWPKKFFVVFKAPPPGQRHIFRKSEAYAQLLLLPGKLGIEPAEMSADENDRRRKLEHEIAISTSHIASNIWRNPSGYAFNNHYKILARAFQREGMAGVEKAAHEAYEIHRSSLPADKPIEECLTLAGQLLAQEKYREARSIYTHVLERDSANAEATARLGIIAACLDVPLLAVKLMQQAVALQPRSSLFRSNLGEILRRVGRYDEAEAALRSALQLNPNDANALSNLGLTLAHQGRAAEGAQACRAAIVLAPQMAVTHLRMAQLLVAQGQTDGARAFFQAALSFDPTLEEARAGLADLAGRGTTDSA